MNLLIIFFIGFIAQFSTIQADQISTSTKAILISLDDHILPNDHPIKGKLDFLFSANNVLSSPTDFKKAGFYTTKERRKGLIVTGHPSFPGYLFKLYLDTSSTDEVEQILKRINGAVLIQNALDKNNYNHIMKVPKKYAYAVPKGKNPGKYPKKYILVVEDMDIFSDDETRKLYKTIITKEHVEALYVMLTSCLLSDSTWLPNIPFSHDGRIAFIDTEFAGNSQTIWSRLGRMSKNLNPEMRSYWTTIVMENHKQKSLNTSYDVELDLATFVEASDVEEFDVLSYEFDIHPASVD